MGLGLGTIAAGAQGAKSAEQQVIEALLEPIVERLLRNALDAYFAANTLDTELIRRVVDERFNLLEREHERQRRELEMRKYEFEAQKMEYIANNPRPGVWGSISPPSPSAFDNLPNTLGNTTITGLDPEQIAKYFPTKYSETK
jgi:hypothetical protein